MPTCYDEKRLSARAGGMRVSSIGALTDTALSSRLFGYKTGTARRFFSLGESDIATRLPPGQLWVSRKLDGECTFLYHTKDETILVSPTGRVIVGSKPAAEARRRLLAAKVERAIVPGELYVAQKGRERAHDVPRALAEGATKDLVDALRFAPYDLIEVGTEQAITWPYEQRLKTLREWFGTEAGPVHVVHTEAVKGSTEVKDRYENWVIGEGAEGLVVRCEQPVAYKIKPWQTLDVAVIGYVEGREDKTGTIRELLVAVLRPGGLFHILGSVGGGFTEEERQSFLCTLKTLDAPSEYVETNRNYFAYQMVRPELVIQVRANDLLQEDSRGRPTQQMVLRFDREARSAAVIDREAPEAPRSIDGSDGEMETGWRIVRKLPLCSLLFPVFERVRTDKQVSEQDCGLRQVTDLFVVPDADVVAAPVQMQPSALLRREVYTKTTKGATAVRKLVVWKTNKEQADPLYPAYVLHFTDFSPGRADMLQREVRVAHSAERINALAEEMLAENIKKGWTKA